MNKSLPADSLRLAVIGGGVSGLAAAYRLHELAPHADIALFEAGPRTGGALHTERRDGFLIERGADMFTTRDSWALDLCRRLEMTDELIGVNETHRRAFVVHRGRLVPTPPGFMLMSPARIWPVVTTPLLSWRGKLRLACEYCISAKRDQQDESLAQFATRRMGREAYERLIQPLVGGIYTADPHKLSMAAAMPQFVEIEQRYGSLIRGARKGALTHGGAHGSGARANSGDADSGARYGMFVAPRDGMGRLAEALAGYLPAGCVRTNSPVTRLQYREGDKWRLSFGGAQRAESFDGVIVAAPAPSASLLTAEVDPELAADLSQIDYASAAVAVLAYRRDRVEHPLDGFGFVVPAIEKRRVLAASFSSVKFAGRAPNKNVLLRVFIGGACQPELVDLDDREIETLVRDELKELIGARAEPLFCDVVRWRGAMPQYHVGHLQLVGQIEQRAARLPGFALAGNAYRGVGVPFCINSGEQAAQRVLEAIANREPA